MVLRAFTTLGMLSLSIAPAAESQQAAALPDRSGRIVVYSPHFDDPPPVGGGLSCPAAAVHLIGFEGVPVADSSAQLVVRTIRHPRSRTDPRDTALPGVTVRLVRRVDTPPGDSLPLTARWVTLTDSAGIGRLTVPQGYYEVQFQLIGFRYGTGILNIRAAEGDSVHAYMDSAPIC